MKGKKMKNNKRKAVILSAMVSCLLLSACSHPSGIGETLSDKENLCLRQEVVGASSYGNGSISVNETGIFYYGDGPQLCYYEYDTDTKYVLCNKPQCRHNSESCNAYMGNMEICGGYALYGDSIYVFYRKYGSKYLELARMDVTGGEKQVVARIYAGDAVNPEKMDEWDLGYVGEVYYHQGYAYLQVSFYKNTDVSDNEESAVRGEQLLAVRLADGEIVELTDILMYGTEALDVNYQLFSDDKVVFSVSYRENVDENVNMQYLQNPDGKMIDYRVFNPATGEVEDYYTGRVAYVKDGSYYQNPLQLLGSCEGKWLAADEKWQYFWIDEETLEREPLPDISGIEHIYGAFYGNAENMLYDGNKLLAAEGLDGDTAQIFAIDLTTGKRKNLFVDSWEGQDQYLFMKDTADWVVFRENSAQNYYYVVRKKDFESDGMKQARKVSF